MAILSHWLELQTGIGSSEMLQVQVDASSNDIVITFRTWAGGVADMVDESTGWMDNYVTV